MSYRNQVQSKSHLLERISRATQTLLKYSPQAQSTRDYLKGRINKYTQEEFGFGYFPPGQDLNEILEIVDEDSLREAGLVYNKPTTDGNCVVEIKHSYFHYHNLVFPYRDVYGNIVGLVGRSLLTEEEIGRIKKDYQVFIPKYKNTDLYKSQHLFGLHAAKEEIISKGYVILVEGQFDYLSCFEAGIFNVVALGGVSFSNTQFYLLLRYTDRIYLLLDNDEAGRKATPKIIQRFSHQAQIGEISLPTQFKDIDAYLKSGEDYQILRK